MESRSKSFRNLLQLGNDNTISGAGKDYWQQAGVDTPKTLFKTPATAEEITKLEDRLGIALPEDYKEFLSISNGFGAGNVSEDDVYMGSDGIYNGYFPDPELFSTDKVNWNSEPYFQLPVELLQLPYEIINLARCTTKKNSDGSLDFDTPLPLFDRVLEIGFRDIDNIWLVPPELVKQARTAYLEMYEKADDQQKKIIEEAIEKFAGSKETFEKLEWCCVKWAAGGSATMDGYAGFGRYIEDLVYGGIEANLCEGIEAKL